MPDNLKTAKSALATLHHDMEAINKLAKPSYLSVIEQMERTLKPIRRQQLEISRALELSGAAARIQEIVSANQHWQDLIKQATATSRITESLSAAHQSWLDTIKPIQHDFSQLSQLQASAKSGRNLYLSVSKRWGSLQVVIASLEGEWMMDSDFIRDVLESLPH